MHRLLLLSRRPSQPARSPLTTEEAYSSGAPCCPFPPLLRGARMVLYLHSVASPVGPHPLPPPGPRSLVSPSSREVCTRTYKAPVWRARRRCWPRRLDVDAPLLLDVDAGHLLAEAVAGVGSGGDLEVAVVHAAGVAEDAVLGVGVEVDVHLLVAVKKRGGGRRGGKLSLSRSQRQASHQGGI